MLLRTTKYYKVLLRTTQYYYSILQSTTPYYKVLHSTTPYYTVLLRTTKYTQYSARRHLGDSKHNVTVTFMIPFAEHWNVQYNARINSCNLKFAFRYSFARWTHRILREGSSSKIKMCVSLQRPATKNFEMYVSLQRRVQKWMKQVSDVHGTSRHTKIIVLPQFQTSDQHEVTKGLRVELKNLRFTNSFGRPTSTKWWNGCASAQQICISPQFWASDDHFLRQGLLGEL